MKEQLKCKVVMLPTNKEPYDNHRSRLHRTKIGNLDTLEIMKNPVGNGYFGVSVPQHLYLVSDREIKVGNWYHNPSKSLFGDPHNEKCEYEHEAKACLNEPVCKKIEASTDTSLNLPLISQSFIEAYVKANGKIDEVNIEMTNFKEWYKNIDRGYPTLDDLRNITEVKTREDNTIIIHQAKTYTRDKVIKALEFGITIAIENLLPDGFNDIKIFESKDKWIEENL